MFSNVLLNWNFQKIGSQYIKIYHDCELEHNSWKPLVKDSPIQRSETMKGSFSSAESLAVKRFQCDG